ncbi:MAG: Ig-like domain repeat protein [Acidobacteriota bacterium]|nr:Ig-like domain repeat protein [Acidobacteriota bacterium]
MRRFRGLILFFSMTTAVFAAGDRIAADIDNSRTAPLRLQGHFATAAGNDLGPANPDFPIAYATLFFEPSQGLESFLAEQQNPSSPNYHRWLTPEQFGQRFGLSDNDLSKVAGWLRSQGFAVHDVARGRQWITFSGTALQAGRAFHTEIHRYSVNGEIHFANATPLAIPSALAGAISGVAGLDDFRLKPLYRRLAPKLTSGRYHYLAPDDLATIYDASPLYQKGIDGSGQKVAILGQTDLDLSDLQAFRAMFNLPGADPQVMLFGPDPGTSQSDLVEANLDLEYSSAMARHAAILYVNSLYVELSAQYAVDQNVAPVMSMSYGGCELESSLTLRAIAQQANAQGITWLVSSGDTAAATCDWTAPTPQAQHGLTVSFPSSLPEVTSVGGTEFNEAGGLYWSVNNSANDASALSYIPERVWNDSFLQNGLIGGGGGASAVYAKPSWQTGPGVPGDGARDLPDVSFAASADHDGYQILYQGQVYIVGGTSASSPVFAGMLALLNQSLAASNPGAPAGLGNINPILYRLAQSTSDVFHDVTTGDNIVPCAQGSPDCVNGGLGYTAGPGYDLASGLGSADLAKMIAEWNTGTASTTTVAIAPGSFTYSDSVQVTATVTGAGAVPAGSVTFVSGEVQLGVVSLTSGDKSSTATLTVDGSLLAGGDGTIGALYGGDGNFLPSGGSASATLQIPGSGSFVVASVTPNPVAEVAGEWPYTLRVSELAGVGTTITAFTINGRNDLANIQNRSVDPHGVMLIDLVASGLSAPLTRVYHLEGLDADGTTWSRDLSVPFVGGSTPALSPAITLSLSPATVQQNPQANPSCQWSQQLTVQESGGFEVTLSILNVGGTAVGPGIFGATRLAPRGMLTGTMCFPSSTLPGMKTYTIAGIADTGDPAIATATATLSAPASSAVTFSVSGGPVTIGVADPSQSGAADLDLAFGSGAPAWTASILPSAQKWLTLSGASGSGKGKLTLQASGAGLANGVYNAIVSIEAPGAIPEAIQVPVAFAVGASSSISISGLGNAASGTQSFAPGQLIAVYGAGLAPDTDSAAIQPLPLEIFGTSATVNGVAAPLWFVSSGQVNLQIPYETAAGTAVLGVMNGGKVASYLFNVVPAAPGIFTFTGGPVPFASGSPGQTLVCFITGDGDVTPSLASGASVPSGTPLSKFPHSRLPLTMTIGGEPAQIVFNGIVPGLIGVTQVNFTIPADLQPGPQPMVVSVGNASSEPVTLTVTAPAVSASFH